MADTRRDFDVVVLGGGPAGVAAAATAAECGRRVALLDGSEFLGGQIWHNSAPGEMPHRARQWFARLEISGATVLNRTTAVASLAPGCLLAERPNDALEIGWDRLILAVGARELFVPFPGWTLPNVLGAGGGQLLSKTGWPLEGKRVVVAGSGPLLLAAAAGLKRHGARIGCVVEQAPLRKLARFGLTLPWLAPAKLLQAAGLRWNLRGVPYRTGCWPLAADGDDQLRSVTFSDGQSTWTEPCDYLACAFGLTANLQWPRLLGCRIERDNVTVDSLQQTSVAGVYCAGEAAGIGGVDAALIEGQIAGYAAAEQPAAAKRLLSARRRTRRFADAMAEAFSLRPELKKLATKDTIVCRCEDVTLGQLEEHGDWRSAKLQTRCGMGPCQGRICQGALQFLHDWRNESARPPVLPVRVESLAGAQIDPVESGNRGDVEIP